MRTVLCILLLLPGLVSGSVFKCITNGKTIYSQHPCGENSRQVENQIVVVPAQMPSTGESSSRRAGSEATSSGAAKQDAASAPRATTTAAADCKARIQQYMDAQTCFNQYRVKGGALKPEAAENCPDAKYPQDCAPE